MIYKKHTKYDGEHCGWGYGGGRRVGVSEHRLPLFNITCIGKGSREGLQLTRAIGLRRRTHP